MKHSITKQINKWLVLHTKINSRDSCMKREPAPSNYSTA